MHFFSMKWIDCVPNAVQLLHCTLRSKGEWWGQAEKCNNLSNVLLYSTYLIWCTVFWCVTSWCTVQLCTVLNEVNGLQRVAVFWWNILGLRTGESNIRRLQTFQTILKVQLLLEVTRYLNNIHFSFRLREIHQVSKTKTPLAILQRWSAFRL